jgi:hypothetical protein
MQVLDYAYNTYLGYYAKYEGVGALRIIRYSYIEADSASKAGNPAQYL